MALPSSSISLAAGCVRAPDGYHRRCDPRAGIQQPASVQSAASQQEAMPAPRSARNRSGCHHPEQRRPDAPLDDSGHSRARSKPHRRRCADLQMARCGLSTPLRLVAGFALPRSVDEIEDVTGHGHGRPPPAARRRAHPTRESRPPSRQARPVRAASSTKRFRSCIGAQLNSIAAVPLSKRIMPGQIRHRMSRLRHGRRTARAPNRWRPVA